jgi:DNA-binding MarR family transcriptional regulator
MSKAGAKKEDLAEYQTQVILTILHIMGNLRHSGMSVLSEVELSYPQILVLYALLETGGSTIGGLSQHLKISQGVISRTVDRLADKGMVERERDEDDRRVVQVGLSPEGNDFATKMITYHVDKFGDQFNKIDRDDRDTFLKLLKEIDSRLEKQALEE